MLCFNDSGQAIEIPSERLQQRPAVYGVLIEGDQILLLPEVAAGCWRLPGGLAGPDEPPRAALMRHLRQSANIAPMIGSLLLVEDRCWVEDTGQGWLLTGFYYELRRQIAGVAGLIDFENPARPEWVPLDSLTRQTLLFGYDAIQAGFVHRQLRDRQEPATAS